MGGAGVTLFTRSLPPPPGTETEKIAELERMLARTQELDIDVHEDEFGYWKAAVRPTGRRT